MFILELVKNAIFHSTIKNWPMDMLNDIWKVQILPFKGDSYF